MIRCVIYDLTNKSISDLWPINRHLIHKWMNQILLYFIGGLFVSCSQHYHGESHPWYDFVISVCVHVLMKISFWCLLYLFPFLWHQGWRYPLDHLLCFRLQWPKGRYRGRERISSKLVNGEECHVALIKPWREGGDEQRDPCESALEFSLIVIYNSPPFLHFSFQWFLTVNVFMVKFLLRLFRFFSLLLPLLHTFFQLNTDKPDTAPLLCPLLRKSSPVRMGHSKPQHTFDSEQCDYPSYSSFICSLLHLGLYLLWGPLTVFHITSVLHLKSPLLLFYARLYCKLYYYLLALHIYSFIQRRKYLELIKTPPLAAISIALKTCVWTSFPPWLLKGRQYLGHCILFSKCVLRFHSGIYIYI